MVFQSAGQSQANAYFLDAHIHGKPGVSWVGADTLCQVFRPNDNVDIDSFGTGYNIGNMRAGEFLRYTVDVTTYGAKHFNEGFCFSTYAAFKHASCKNNG